MATYLYETTDVSRPIEQFEIQQSMLDAALVVHPQSGVPIRRVISGGFGVMSKGGPVRPARTPAPSGNGGCGSGCGCH